MRILVISHNIFSDTESMGKTLSGYFTGWDKEKIAQFYIHSEVPTSDKVCKNYFRITDIEALKSVFSRKCGKAFSENDIETERLSPRTDSGKIADVYQRGRKRTPLIYLARNTIWRFSAWNNKALKKWIDHFNPDAVFFASGDYSFLYRIALKIAKKRNIPLVISCMDDYYINNKNKDKFLGNFTHNLFLRQVKKTMEYSGVALCICDKMSRDYEKIFGIKCRTLHTPSGIGEPLSEEKKNEISYIGNLGYSRHLQLVEIGKALKELNLPQGPDKICVYSSEPREEILSHLTEENGIAFRGQIPYDEVKRVIGSSIAVIHTESFEKRIADSVRYSVSTKIADSLASGTCLFAFGPSNVASFEYLKENNAAVVVTDKNDLKESLEKLITDKEYRESIEENAVMLAQKNHSLKKNTELVKNTIEQLIKKPRP